MQLNTKEVKKALSLMVKGGNNVLPILDNILIQSKDGKVTFTSSNLRQTVRVELDGSDEQFTACIDAALFTSTISAIDVESFDFVSDGTTVTITTATGVFRMPTVDSSDFPQQDFAGEWEMVEWQPFIDKLTKASTYVSSDELRLAMTTVLVDFSENVICATDAHKLYTASLDKYGLTSRILLPAEIVPVLAKIDGGIVGVSVGDRSCDFKFENVMIKTNIVDANFPAFKAVIPQSSALSVKVNRKELLNTVKRCKIYAGDNDRVTFLFTPFDTTVSAVNIDRGQECKEVIGGNCTGQITISMMGANVLKMLNTFDDDYLELQLNAPNQALVCKSGDELVLIMPVVF